MSVRPFGSTNFLNGISTSWANAGKASNSAAAKAWRIGRDLLTEDCSMNRPGAMIGNGTDMRAPEAAVAIVHARGAPSGSDAESVLLIRRTERPNDPWSGHWSFPGGRR